MIGKGVGVPSEGVSTSNVTVVRDGAYVLEWHLGVMRLLAAGAWRAFGHGFKQLSLNDGRTC